MDGGRYLKVRNQFVEGKMDYTFGVTEEGHPQVFNLKHWTT